jgi:ribose transport system substrate-binding protein
MRRIIAAVFVTGAVVACGGGGTPDSGKPTKLRFAIVPKALDIPVFVYARIGAQSEAEARGNVEVIWRAPESADPLKQKEILESLITQRVDGIAVSCTNGDFLTPTIDKAMAAGIPVITWDADAPKSKRIAYYGVDDFKGGQILGQEAVKALNGRGTVALMTSLGAYNLKRRLDGVLDALGKAPGIKIVDTFDAQESITRASEILGAASNKYPKLDAWISVGGWPIMTRNMLDPVNTKHTKVFSFDTIPPAPELVKAGKVQLLVGQKYFGWGTESVKLLAQIKAGQMPKEQIIDSGVDVVTAANVDEYLKQWRRLEKGLR